MGETRQAELTPEERVERVRMALAEAGYPHARVSRNEDRGVAIALDPDGIPPSVAWRALALSQPSDGSMICWPCNEIGAWPCPHDFRTQPWPPSSPTAEPPERRR